jgi:hypothetical protein
MDNELGLGNEVQGRIFQVTVYGDTAAEIEVAALTAAQEFFGDGVPLEVVQDYKISGTIPSDGSDKKYRVGVKVRALH